MEGGASHAKEDAELQNRSSVSYEGLLIFFRRPFALPARLV
jgi:hypothetical protein